MLSDDINDLNKSFDELMIGDEFLENGEGLPSTVLHATSTPRRARRSLSSQFCLTETPKKTSEGNSLPDNNYNDKFDTVTDDEVDVNRGIKHDLTPNSKTSNQPKPKRFVVGRTSRKEIETRKSEIEDMLNASFVQQDGCEVNRAAVESHLGIDNGNTSLLTRTIKEVFPGVTTRRDRVNSMYPF